MAFRGPGSEPPGDPAVGGIPPGTGDSEQREGREGVVRRFARGERLSGQGLRSHRCGLVVQGAFRYVHADAAGEEHVVGYAFAGEFVGDYISMCVDAPSQVTIGAMCGAEALLVPGERLETFYRTDAACERLGRRLAEHMLAEVYERLLDRYAASPQQRYEALTERCPDVLQLVPLRELASYLGVRPETLLEELAASRPGSFCYAAADIMDPAAACAALERLAGELGGMDLCVVSAGTGDLNPGLDYALEEPAIRTNVVGWTAAVDWAYGRFEERGGGHLVVITSVGGLRGGGAAPAYNASKAYQINYAEGLRQRAAKSGLPLPVTDIRPGFVATKMAKGEGLFWVMPVDRVVEGIVRAIRRRRSVAVVTRRWRLPAWLIRHMPECIYRKMG